MTKHKGNSIKNVKQKHKQKKKKNDENQIKNANPNPNREKTEKRAIENFSLFTKSCQHFFSNYTKL